MDLQQLIKIAELLEGSKEAQETTKTDDKVTEYDFIGKKVLIRAHLKGVQVGIVDSVQGNTKIKLTPSRKLWRWQAKKGIALESLAKYGIAEGTRATAIVDVDYIGIDDACGIIEISDTIYQEIMDWSESEQD